MSIDLVLLFLGRQTPASGEQELRTVEADAFGARVDHLLERPGDGALRVVEVLGESEAVLLLEMPADQGGVGDHGAVRKAEEVEWVHPKHLGCGRLFSAANASHVVT